MIKVFVSEEREQHFKKFQIKIHFLCEKLNFSLFHFAFNRDQKPQSLRRLNVDEDNTHSGK